MAANLVAGRWTERCSSGSSGPTRPHDLEASDPTRKRNGP
jgi:hypothetical protein